MDQKGWERNHKLRFGKSRKVWKRESWINPCQLKLQELYKTTVSHWRYLHNQYRTFQSAGLSTRKKIDRNSETEIDRARRHGTWEETGQKVGDHRRSGERQRNTLRVSHSLIHGHLPSQLMESIQLEWERRGYKHMQTVKTHFRTRSQLIGRVNTTSQEHEVNTLTLTFSQDLLTCLFILSLVIISSVWNGYLVWIVLHSYSIVSLCIVYDFTCNSVRLHAKYTISEE